MNSYFKAQVQQTKKVLFKHTFINVTREYALRFFITSSCYFIEVTRATPKKIFMDGKKFFPSLKDSARCHGALVTTSEKRGTRRECRVCLFSVYIIMQGMYSNLCSSTPFLTLITLSRFNKFCRVTFRKSITLYRVRKKGRE